MTSDPDHVGAARAVYDASAETYVRFAGVDLNPSTEDPVDLAMLEALVALVDRPGRRAVVDAGCGPGRAAAFLAATGLDVVGVDVAHAMVAAARRAHPGIAFVEGRLDDLPFGDACAAAVVSWYSVIHVPPAGLGDVFAEFARVTAPDGWVLVAFQAGQAQAVHRSDAHGTGLPLTSYRHSPPEVAARLDDAGFQLHATAVREPRLAHESDPQAILIARQRRPSP